MKNKKGWTLIELLVVVLIIGILAAIAVPQYQKAVAKSHTAEALSIIKSIRPAIDEYLLTNGKCPENFNDLSLLPTGEMSKYYFEGDKIIGQYYDFVLVGCRIDAGALNRNSLIPNFLYQFGQPTSMFPNLEEGQTYCYYLTTEGYADTKDLICQSLSNSEKIQLGTSVVRAYKI